MSITRTMLSKLQLLFITSILFVTCYVLLFKTYSRELIWGSISPKSNLNWLNSDVTIIDFEELQKLDQKDSRLINYVKARHLTPPSKLPYNLTGKFTPKRLGGDSQTSIAVKRIFKGVKNGFFVECGAFDGLGSTTLSLEKDHGWSGLLIECNPLLIPELKKVHRKAYTADVCVSVTEHPAKIEIMSMDSWPASSSVGKGDIFPQTIPSKISRYEVSSFPIYSLIAATGAKVVDFFTLDVQSIEWQVIRNFPFEFVFVKVWIIEVVLLNPKEQEDMKILMKSKGYRDPIETGYYKDYLFIHSSVPLDDKFPKKFGSGSLPPPRSYRGRSA